MRHYASGKISLLLSTGSSNNINVHCMLSLSISQPKIGISIGRLAVTKIFLKSR